VAIQKQLGSLPIADPSNDVPDAIRPDLGKAYAAHFLG
jgi:hypothetical protein